MKIGLWSDAVNFPNLAQMKLSAYHKSIGDTVELIEENGHYDKAYLSKVFNLPAIKRIPTGPPTFYADEVSKGGTGYAIEVVDGKEVFHKEKDAPLPKEVEHIYPDYSLFPEYADTAYGFLTRGCCNDCSFCIVSKKEGRCSRRVADLNEFWRDQKIIKLLDPNLLACRDREILLQQLIDSKSRVDFTQGLDARFITDDVMRLLVQIKVQNIHFAFDFMKNEKAILRGFDCFNRHYKKSRWNLNCYILTNYDTTHQEDWYRVRMVQERGFHPYVMIYQKGTHDRFLTDLQRWSNQPMIYKSTSFPDYVPRKDGKSCRELYPDILQERTMILMPRKKAEEIPTEAVSPTPPEPDTSGMNVYQKLLAVRSEFLSAGAKKSGKNLHAEFMYFELVDIVPTATTLFRKYGLLPIMSFADGMATAKVVDVDDMDDFITFYVPLQFINEPGKFRMNEVQGVGAAVTYYRRYLYMLILDLVEADAIDNQNGDKNLPSDKPAAPKKGPATKAERNALKAALTASQDATPEQMAELKAKCKQLLAVDDKADDFVTEIALNSNNFTSLTLSGYTALNKTVDDMIAAAGQN